MPPVANCDIFIDRNNKASRCLKILHPSWHSSLWCFVQNIQISRKLISPLRASIFATSVTVCFDIFINTSNCPDSKKECISTNSSLVSRFQKSGNISSHPPSKAPNKATFCLDGIFRNLHHTASILNEDVKKTQDYSGCYFMQNIM